jgi:DNA-binding transcriptional LysR family regulator
VRAEPARRGLEDADIALQFREPVEEGVWRRRVIGHVMQRLLASSDYLARHGRPTTIDDLDSHRILLWQAPGERSPALTTAGGTRFEVAPFFASDHAHLVRLLATQGVGIGWALDQPLPVPDIDRTEERLQVVLGGVVEREIPVACYLPAGRVSTPRARAAAELVSDLLAGLLGPFGAGD